GILDAGPGESWVEIVAAIQEEGPGVDLLADLLSRLFIFRPDRGRKPVRAVIHELNCLLVGGNFHDADDGAESLFTHDIHLVVHIDQNLWTQIRSAGPGGGEMFLADQGARAGAFRLFDLTADEGRCRSANHGTYGRSRIERAAKLVFSRQVPQAFD